MKIYPLKFKPVYKNYPWGNNRLPALFNREAPEGIYAESWEVSTHHAGESMVINGPLAGMTLSEVLALDSAAVLGSAVEGNDFPLLIKLIDAAQPLSVQVHPNNENAAAVQGEPKTEMWYFLNEEPSQIYCGLKPGTTRDDFLSAMKNETLEAVLRKLPAEKGGAVFVPGGCLHAIDAGCLILEVQQNSNTTYRVYDWNRVGTDGRPREMHVEKALQVIDFNDTGDSICHPVIVSDNVRTICKSDFFVLNELTIEGAMQLEANGQSFHVLFSAEGSIEIEYGDGQTEHVPTGTSILIPALLGAYAIKSKALLRVLHVSIDVPPLNSPLAHKN